MEEVKSMPTKAQIEYEICNLHECWPIATRPAVNNGMQLETKTYPPHVKAKYPYAIPDIVAQKTEPVLTARANV